MRRHSKIKILFGILIAVILITAFGVGLYVYENYGNDRGGRGSQNLDKELKFGDKTYEISHDIEAYLLIGTDDSMKEEAEETGEYIGGMADFQLLFVMDRTANKYGFLQLNRDTITDVSLLDENDKMLSESALQICISHTYGSSPEKSCENTEKDVSELLGGMPIDGYYSISMHDIPLLNQSVGGVRLTIQEDLTVVDPAFREGATLTLSDKQAEKFVRARMSVGDGENTSRMQRQLQFMEAYKKQVKERSKDDPAFVNDLYNQLREVAVTDIPGNRASAIANFMYKADDRGILQYEGTKEEGDTLGDGEIHAEFYADEESVIKALKTLCGIGEN